MEISAMRYLPSKERAPLVVLLFGLLFFGRLAWAGKPLGVFFVIIAVIAIVQQFWVARRQQV